MRTTSRTLALLLASTLAGAAPALAQAQAQGSEADRLSHVDGNLPDAANAPGRPAETAEPNAPSQKPAFENQTRAPQPAELAKVETAVLADGLPHLWAMEFLPDGRLLVTAKKGAMMVLSADGKTRTEVAGVPEVASSGQGGLLDVALSPGFAEDGMVYFTFSEPREGGGNGTSLASARLVIEGEAAKLEGMKVIYQQIPAYDGTKHFGSRIVFSPEGQILLGVGERSDTPIRDQAQDLNSGLGKVFRINADGSIPQDNPFLAKDDAQDAIWSYGHRNIQSAALDGDGRLWVVEHGARGGDELNRPEAGKNYGWPIITYGIDYGGKPIGEGKTVGEGMEQPVYYWDPVIGPSGMALYQGDEFPGWQGAFLIGGLVTQGLVVVHLEGDRVKSEERVPLEARIRDVKVGPDGAVYALTERREGEGSSTILRLAAAD